MIFHQGFLWSRRAACVLTLCGCVFLTGCSSGTKTEQASTPTQTQPAAKTISKTPFVPVDACSLMSKTEAEAITGKALLEPMKEEAANLVTCSYGDPSSPKLPNGRALNQLLSLAVFTGEEGAYYAGPVAQAKDAYDTGRKNAASPENVAGLGQDAYWDQTFHTLNVYRDRYELSVTVDSALGLKVARAAAEKALTKLP